MQTVLQDLRYAVRQLWKSPGFTLAALLTLSIGIGANTAIFSMMDAVILRPLAVPEMDRVVVIAEAQEGTHSAIADMNYKQATLGNFEDWKRQSGSFENLAVYSAASMSMTGAGDAAHVPAVFTTADFFRVLQARPLLGRVFVDAEAQQGRDSVAILNYGFWQNKFAGDANVLGKRIELDQRAYTVIGVMPKTLQYPSTADIFLPFAPTDQQLSNRTEHEYFAIGRLRNGVTTKEVQAEMHLIAERLAKAYPATNLGWSVKVEPLLDRINGTLTPLYFRMIQGATLFVLLVVCANVANLQFARGIARRPEIAMRTALGAGRWRLIRQLLTENLLLGLAGAAGGLAVAQLDLHLSLVSMPPRVARYMAGWSNVTLDGRALAFSLVLAVLTGVVSGFAPALEAMRVNLVDQLKAGSRAAIGSGRAHRLRSLFAVAQISLAVALVIGAALMAKGMWSMLHFADAYGPKQALTFEVALPEARYDTPQKIKGWYDNSLEKLRALPGVKHAELALALPYSDRAWLDDCEIENRPVVPGKFQSALHLLVSEGYFSTIHVPIVSGRGFTKSDSLDTLPVAVVSRKFVARYFPGENPIGHKIRMGGLRGSHDPWMTIVGVAEDANYSWWDQAAPEAVYISVAQAPPLNETYVVVAGGDPLAIAPAARKALAGIDPALPLDNVQTYDQLLHESLTGLLYAAGYMAFDALIALLLAAIGIFAVMANLVGERTREIGVRLAMGARREDVLGMILRRAAWLTGMGIAAGLVMAFGLARLTANLLAGVRPDDPVVFAGITATIIAIALGASWMPARRAAQIEPMAALRDE
jgi:putative ABC transport system permease protein